LIIRVPLWYVVISQALTDKLQATQNKAMRNGFDGMV
jgi:hypothetical protein